MAVRKIIQFPDPRLKQACRAIKSLTSETNDVLIDLVDTLYHSPGVGLAAPQIGRLIRAVVVDVTQTARPGRKSPKGHGLIALFNPVVTERRGEQVFREGCLSIPEFLADVKRSAWIHVEGINKNGDIVRLETNGFEAVAVQHEIDHLDGILFLDHVENTKMNLFRRQNINPVVSFQKRESLSGGEER